MKRPPAAGSATGKATESGPDRGPDALAPGPDSGLDHGLADSLDHSLAHDRKLDYIGHARMIVAWCRRKGLHEFQPTSMLKQLYPLICEEHNVVPLAINLVRGNRSEEHTVILLEGAESTVEPRNSRPSVPGEDFLNEDRSRPTSALRSDSQFCIGTLDLRPVQILQHPLRLF
jgi:hypothetical protein